REAAEISHAPTHDGPRRLAEPPGAPSAPPAADGPGEADPRRCVQLPRDPVGAEPEQRVDGGVVLRRPGESGRFEPRAVGELQAAPRAPDVAQIERAAPGRPRLLERSERAGELRRLPRGEGVER